MSDTNEGFQWSTEPHVYLPNVGPWGAIERWEIHEDAQRELDRIGGADPDAYDFLVGAMDLWADIGYQHAKDSDTDVSELDAPAGLQVLKQVNQAPWLGEIKETETKTARVKGKHAVHQYRFYFIDISQREGMPEYEMYIALGKEKETFPLVKDTSKRNRQVRDAQNSDMKAAMNIGKSWCIENELSWRLAQ